MAKKVEYIIALKDKTAAALKKATGNFKDYSKTVKKESKGISGSLKEIKANLGSMVALTALIKFGKKLIATASEIKAISDRANIGAEAMQAFSESAKDGGATISEVNIALVTLRKQQQNAINGMPEAVKSFEALGLSIEFVAKATNEELLEAVAKGIKATGDFGSGFKLMGESTARVHKAIDDLANVGMEGLIKKHKKHNLLMSSETIARLEDTGNSMRKLASQGVANLGNAFSFAQKQAERMFTVMMNPSIGTAELNKRLNSVGGPSAGTGAGRLEELKRAEADALAAVEAETNEEKRKKLMEEAHKHTEAVMKEFKKQEAEQEKALKEMIERELKQREDFSNQIADAEIAGIKDETAREIAQIGKSLQDKLKTLKGGTAEELKLRKQLAQNAQAEINKVLEDGAKSERGKFGSNIDAKKKAIADANLGMMGFQAAIDDANKSPDERKAEEKARRREASALAKVERASFNKNFKASKKDMEIARVAGLKAGFKDQQEKKKKAMQELAELEKKSMNAMINLDKAITGGNK